MNLYFDENVSICSDHPLVLYVFTTDSKIQELFVNHTRSGSVCINDTMMQYIGKNQMNGEFCFEF